MDNYTLENILDSLRNEVNEMLNFISDLKPYLDTHNDLSSDDLRDIRNHLMYYNFPKYFELGELLEELAAEKETT